MGEAVEEAVEDTTKVILRIMEHLEVQEMERMEGMEGTLVWCRRITSPLEEQLRIREMAETEDEPVVSAHLEEVAGEAVEEAVEERDTVPTVESAGAAAVGLQIRGEVAVETEVKGAHMEVMEVPAERSGTGT